MDLLRLHGLVDTLLPGEWKSADVEISCLAIVSTRDGVRLDGPLSCPLLSAEAALQHAYYSRPSDAYTVTLHEVALLANPCGAMLRRTSRAQGGVAPVVLDMGGALFYQYWSVDREADDIAVQLDGDQPQHLSAKDWLTLHGVACDAENIPCLLVPISIFRLMAIRKWTHLLCLARWHAKFRRAGLPLPFGDWPGEDWAARVSKAQMQIFDVPSLSADSLMEIGVQMRGWMPRLLAALPADAHNDFKRDMGHLLERVDAWCIDLDSFRGSTVTRVRHQTEKLIECIRLSRALKGGGAKLEFAVQRALQILLPDPRSRAIIFSDIQRPVLHLPSQSTLQRLELSMDVAFMLMRADLAKDSSRRFRRWMWCDASPQQRFDWIHTVYDEMEETHLVPTMIAVWGLSAYSNRLPVGDKYLQEFLLETPPPRDWADLHAPLKNIRRHSCIPVAVTSGHRGVAHKAAAVVHAFVMELPSASATSLRKFCDTFRSFTSDMGTELSFPDFHVDGFDHLVPEWARQCDLQEVFLSV